MARIAWPGGLIGFVLGGILLHRHHPLSGWYPGHTLALERWHVAWDGIFHAVHYRLLALGLVLLWPRRSERHSFLPAIALCACPAPVPALPDPCMMPL